MKINITECITAGMTKEATFHVQDEHMAIHVGSGSSRVLATPWMIAFMERVCHRLLGDCLPEGYTSVGIHVDIRHTAASPIGSRVHVSCEVQSVEGLQVTFTVQAWDDFEKIGEGVHKRYVVEQARFLEKINDKRMKLDVI
jgi:predicted thioesterase